ncbi:MAG: SCO family protein [Planctomycetes bacterium]|nr:SCO family protein [Planctomycetota bacterium]MBL7009331.1 SCO family protein [Planctomycetota bacterium]
MRRFLLSALLAAAAPACQPAEDLDPIGAVADFELTDQDGQPFTRADLDGAVWVVDFFFTRCPSICPHMTQAMKEIGERFPGEAELKRISITIDPGFDQPAALKAYADRLELPQQGWRFLTGAREDIAELSLESFKLAFGDEMDAEGNILHSSRFVLVDRRGLVRGYYDGLDESLRPRMDRAIRTLLDEPAG